MMARSHRKHERRYHPERRRMDQRYGCSRFPRKVRYADRGQAEAAARRETHVRQLGAYECWACRGWHLTSHIR